MKVNEDNYEILNKTSKLTKVDYDIKWVDAENIEGFVDSETLYYMIEDLLVEIEHWKEKYEDLEEDLRENYRAIPYNEQVCVSDRDFYI